MATAGRAAVLPLAALCCLAAAATAVSRDASPLRSLRTEEGNIDDLISRIELLHQQKRQHHAAPALQLQSAVHAPPAAAHPERKFAYYPSDPEYHAPRRPQVTVRPLHSAGHSSHHSAPLQAAAKHAAAFSPAAATEAPAAAHAVTSADLPVTSRYRGDPEEVSHDPGRHKRPSEDTQVLQVQADALLAPAPNRDNLSDVYFIVTVAGVCAMAVGVTVAGGFCYHRMQKRSKAAGDAEYPAYGVTGPSRDLSPSGDRKLAQSAQMYHYQHQKQQMMAMEKTHNGRHGSASDVDSEEENEEGDYTVYECPGLAPTGEMEVKNPLFQDDQTPAPPAAASDSK